MKFAKTITLDDECLDIIVKAKEDFHLSNFSAAVRYVVAGYERMHKLNGKLQQELSRVQHLAPEETWAAKKDIMEQELEP